MKNKLIAIGEALIDFMPDKTGCAFYEVTGFEPKVGGAPANVCCAYTVLGGRSGMITQLGNDPFGDKILRELISFGIDTSQVARTEEANTALAFVSLSPNGDRTFSFYRKPSADMLYTAQQLDPAYFSDAYAFHFCSVDLGEFPMREAHLRAIEYAKKSGAIVSFDPNLRFPLWDDREKLRQTVRAFIPCADILKISDEELEFITGETQIKAALPALFAQGVKVVVFTCGAKGGYAFTKTAKAFSEPEPVQAVDTTGAGDGFIGAFLYQLNQCGVKVETLADVDEATLQRCVDFAVRFCSVSVTRRGAMSSYPTLAELKERE